MLNTLSPVLRGKIQQFKRNTKNALGKSISSTVPSNSRRLYSNLNQIKNGVHLMDYKRPLLSVAPMVDYTNRHFRYLLRLLTKHTFLYSEMVVERALASNAHNPTKLDHLLQHDAVEQPVVVQLGGSLEDEIETATRICMQYGYNELNLNLGCPSDSVQKGSFGAILMKDPPLVVRLLKRMIQTVHQKAHEINRPPIPVTAKCRVGVDDLDSYEHLAKFIDTLSTQTKVEVPSYLASESSKTPTTTASVNHFIVHARKCHLKGLSPKQNRTIPVLNYDFVFQLMRDFPHLHFTINGGVETLEQAKELLDKGIHGVMIGRASFNNTWMLSEADSKIFEQTIDPLPQKDAVLKKYLDYAAQQQETNSVPSTILLKPLQGLFTKQFNKEILLKRWKDLNLSQIKSDFEANYTNINKLL